MNARTVSTPSPGSPRQAGRRFLLTIAAGILCLATTLTPAAEDDEIARLTAQKQELAQSLSQLRGKPEELSAAREEIANAYRNLVSLETRLRGFQLWNAMVAALGVFNDSIVKLSPGGSTINALINFTTNFAVDRGVDASKKYDSSRPGGGHLPAKVKKLSDSVVGISPALRLLDQAMRMTPEQVADQLVSRGMVENTWLQRWQNTPDQVAQSNSVVTGKITFIQERIGPAKSALIEARKDIDQVVPAVKAEIDSLQRQIAEIESRISSIQGNKAFLDSVDKARDIALPPPTQDIKLYPGEPKQYGAAAGEHRAAWESLKSGTINGGTYRLIGVKSSYDANAYHFQQMKPFSDAYSAASNYFWNELRERLRGVEDGDTRRQMYQAALSRMIKAADDYRRASEKESQAMRSGYYEPVKQLGEEEKAESERRAAYYRRFDAFRKETVAFSWANPWEMKLESRQETIRNLGTSGYHLALSAWSPIYSLGYLWPATAPIGPLKGSAERYREWRERAGKIRDYARLLFDTAKSQSGSLSGYASQADAFAKEIEPNIALWDGLQWYYYDYSLPSDSALQLFATLNQSSTLFSQYAAVREQEAKAMLAPHQENWERAQRGEPVMRRAEALLPKAQELLEQKGNLYQTFYAAGIINYGASGRFWLEWNHITSEEIDKIRRITAALDTNEAIEQHVLKQMGRHTYWSDDPDRPRHTLETLREARGKYAERDRNAAQGFNDYQSAWNQYIRLERELSGQIARISSELNDVAPGQSVYLQEDELFNQITTWESRWPASNHWYWSPPDPQDLPAGWPNAGSLFEQMEAALNAYEAKIRPFRQEVANGFPKRAAQLDGLAGQARAYATTNDATGGESALGEINRKANDIYLPLATNGHITTGMPIFLAMQRFREAHYLGSMRVGYLRSRDNQIGSYLSWLDLIDALLRQPPNPAGRERAREWQQELERSLQPHSYIGYYVQRGEAAASSALDRGRALQPKLAAYLAAFGISNAQIQALYQSFVDAYGRGDIRTVVGLLASDWRGGDGADARDAEDTLINSFKVFDRIQYRISGFSVQPLGDDQAQVSYSVKIIGDNSRQRLHHEEESQIVEIVGLVDGKPRILRTISGQQWLR